MVTSPSVILTLDGLSKRSSAGTGDGTFACSGVSGLQMAGSAGLGLGEQSLRLFNRAAAVFTGFGLPLEGDEFSWTSILLGMLLGLFSFPLVDGLE